MSNDASPKYLPVLSTQVPYGANDTPMSNALTTFSYDLVATTESFWPDHFPENCPPTEAQQTAVDVYRVAVNSPPNHEDFMTYKEEGKRYNKTNECLACGLSVFKNISDVHTMLQNVPMMRKKIRYILKGNITGESGVVGDTPKHYKSHATWWLYSGLAPEEHFVLLETITL